MPAKTDVIYVLKKEHSEMVNLLKDIEKYINDWTSKGRVIISGILKEFGKFWDEHEKREEEFFELCRVMGKPVPNEIILLQQHREMKGHWKIITEAMNSKNSENFRVALDTDGRMLIEKFRRHIDKENKFLNEAFN